jgi:hypothetical protein
VRGMDNRCGVYSIRFVERVRLLLIRRRISSSKIYLDLGSD